MTLFLFGSVVGILCVIYVYFGALFRISLLIDTLLLTYICVCMYVCRCVCVDTYIKIEVIHVPVRHDIQHHQFDGYLSSMHIEMSKKGLNNE